MGSVYTKALKSGPKIELLVFAIYVVTKGPEVQGVL